MATLFKPRSEKTYKVQAQIEGERRTITLGEVTKSRANEMFGLVERLIDCQERRQRPGATSLLLVEELPRKLQERLRKVGLLDQQQALTLGDLSEYILAELRGSPSTIKKRTNVRANAVAYFGADRLLSDIQPGDADDFRRWLGREGGRGHRQELARATVSRRCGTLKSWFKIACRKGWLTQNPFEDQHRESEANPSRQHFVDVATTEKLLEACPRSAFSPGVGARPIRRPAMPVGDRPFPVGMGRLGQSGPARPCPENQAHRRQVHSHGADLP